MGTRHPIGHYYDSNTRRFLSFGGGAASGAIHRQLWGPDVASVSEASGYINRLLEDAIRRLCPGARPTLLDLGCGVGGTLIHLADAFPDATLQGITISESQIGIARTAAARAGVVDRCRFVLGDFESAALDVAADAAIAVESFVHSRSREAFFAAAARQLMSGGHLIVVDDFVITDESNTSASGRRCIGTFREGWRVPSLCTVDACVQAARLGGFELTEQRDLTPLIRLGRPRDRLIAVIAPIAARLGLTGTPFFGNLVGGNALHRGTRDGLLGYRWLGFRYSR